MADLRAKERAALPDSAFAYVDSAGKRRLPIHDEAHVRNALARFDRVEFEDDAARDRARQRLLRAAKKHGIVPLGFIDHQLRPERRLPTGHVTLLFADIEDSTRLLAQLGDRYGPLLTAVRRAIRSAVRRTGGHEVDARADEYLAAFAAASGALAAATEAQRALTVGPWTAGPRVRVRMGIHTGRPTLTPSGYVGMAVHVGARVARVAAGGQIVVSAPALETMRAQGAELEVRSLGPHRLRGVPDPIDLHEVVL
jgi:class 3 adenylate cyclase